MATACFQIYSIMDFYHKILLMTETQIYTGENWNSTTINNLINFRPLFGGNCGPGYYPDNPNNYPDNRPNYPNNRPNYPDTDPLYNDQDRGCARIWRGQRRFSSFAARESLSARDVRECEKFCRYETECYLFLEFWVFITMVDDHNFRPPCTQKVHCKIGCSLFNAPILIFQDFKSVCLQKFLLQFCQRLH